MSDQTIITLAGMLIGFLTLWVRLKYAGEKADEAAKKAAVVEGKLDANTRTTEAVEAKADTIVQQTNGVTAVMQLTVAQLVERIAKLEEYNRDSTHRLIDAVHAVQLRQAAEAAKKEQADPQQPRGE